jgi:Ca2+:H+ antiporter
MNSVAFPSKYHLPLDTNEIRCMTESPVAGGTMKIRLPRMNPINLLILSLPAALLLEYGIHADPMLIFFASGLAIVPLASLMGSATEVLANRLGEGIGGLLNAA